MRTFVDTNIVLYAYDRHEPEKSTVARAILSDLWRTREGLLSTQVLHELFATVNRSSAMIDAIPRVTLARRVLMAGSETPAAATARPSWTTRERILDGHQAHDTGQPVRATRVGLVAACLATSAPAIAPCSGANPPASPPSSVSVGTGAEPSATRRRGPVIAAAPDGSEPRTIHLTEDPTRVGDVRSARSRSAACRA